MNTEAKQAELEAIENESQVIREARSMPDLTPEEKAEAARMIQEMIRHQHEWQPAGLLLYTDGVLTAQQHHGLAQSCKCGAARVVPLRLAE